MNGIEAAIVVGAAGGFVQAGILIATVRFLGKRQDDYRKETERDLNGLGRKSRAIMAELIIQAKDHPDFAVIVRKLINGI